LSKNFKKCPIYENIFREGDKMPRVDMLLTELIEKVEHAKRIVIINKEL